MDDDSRQGGGGGGGGEMGAFGTHFVNQIPGFESNQELYNLTTGMEMLAFPSKNRDSSNPVVWKSLLNKQGASSSSSPCSTSKNIADFYPPDHFNKPDFSVGFPPSTDNLNWVVHDYACERPSAPTQAQTLSLSLCPNELRQQEHQQEGFFGRSINFQNPSQPQLGSSNQTTHFQLKNSMYFAPTQELLNEFCSLGTKLTDNGRKKSHKMNQWEEENGAGSSRKQSSLNSLDPLELQKTKAKLLSMLEEVDRRYKQYCDQMKSVVLSFEAVVGDGAASMYSALASKAMSRHFRTLRDAIVAQIKATKKAMGDKDPIAPGTTRGETPRLRLLDQTLRQQRAFQQMNMMENHPWRPQRGLPDRSVSILRAWLFEHFLHPYPSDVDKHILARQTGLSRSQVSNWFINARVRLWKPMVEEMYLEETKEQDNLASLDRVTAGLEEQNSRPYDQSHSPNQTLHEDQKPTASQLMRNDSESLSSIINNPERFEPKGSRHNPLQQQRRQLGKDPETFGVVDLDFSSYAPSGSYNSGVSLTLGLQQHGEGGSMNLSFSSPSQHSLFYPRDQIDDCEQAQYSFLDGEGENLPYRNLLGAQILHDFAG